MDTFDFEVWYEKYSTLEIVDLKKHLAKEDFDLLKRLNIEIKDKVYTEQEFELENDTYLDPKKQIEHEKELEFEDEL